MADVLSVEKAVRELLAGLAGRSVAELAQEIDARSVSLDAKNAHASVARRLLEERGLLAGLDERRTTVKVIRLDEEGDPLEKTTFRNFDHLALPRENWETSDLRSETREILWILFGAEKGQDVRDSVLAGSVFWSPSSELDQRIAHDWELCRQAVAYKLPKPKEKDTDTVHIATKGRDSADLERHPDGSTDPKECLAFNKKFVAEILGSR